MCQPPKKVTRRITSEIIEIIEIACKPKAEPKERLFIP